MSATKPVPHTITLSPKPEVKKPFWSTAIDNHIRQSWGKPAPLTLKPSKNRE